LVDVQLLASFGITPGAVELVNAPAFALAPTEAVLQEQRDIIARLQSQNPLLAQAQGNPATPQQQQQQQQQQAQQPTTAQTQIQQQQQQPQYNQQTPPQQQPQQNFIPRQQPQQQQQPQVQQQQFAYPANNVQQFGMMNNQLQQQQPIGTSLQQQQQPVQQPMQFQPSMPMQQQPQLQQPTQFSTQQAAQQYQPYQQQQQQQQQQQAYPQYQQAYAPQAQLYQQQPQYQQFQQPQASWQTIQSQQATGVGVGSGSPFAGGPPQIQLPPQTLTGIDGSQINPNDVFMSLMGRQTGSGLNIASASGLPTITTPVIGGGPIAAGPRVGGGAFTTSSLSMQQLMTPTKPRPTSCGESDYECQFLQACYGCYSNPGQSTHA
jgi:hypothetical protein